MAKELKTSEVGGTVRVEILVRHRVASPWIWALLCFSAFDGLYRRPLEARAGALSLGWSCCFFVERDFHFASTTEIP